MHSLLCLSTLYLRTAPSSSLGLSAFQRRWRKDRSGGKPPRSAGAIAGGTAGSALAAFMSGRAVEQTADAVPDLCGSPVLLLSATTQRGTGKRP
jgi:hypothetical protein